MRVVELLPLFIFAATFTAIVASYVATYSSGVLRPFTDTVLTPPISLLMCAGGGRLIGQIAFPAVLVSALLCTPALHRAVTTALGPTHLPALRGRVRAFFAACLLAFVALAFVGLVPLQPDILRAAVPTPATVFHQVCALVFFLTSMMSLGLWLSLAFAVPPTCPLAFSASRPRSLFKLLCLLLALFPLPSAVALHPASPLRSSLGLSDMDAGGLHQYALVLALAAAFASFSADLRALRPRRAAPSAASLR